MKKNLPLLLALCIAALFSTVSNAQAQSGKTTTTPATDSALLYEISGKDLKKSSYLFGTIHLICQKDMFPAEKLKSYLDRTEQMMLEFDLDDPAAIQKAVSLSMLADGKSVKDYVKPEEYARIDEVYKNYLGVSFDHLQKFKPMISQTYLLTSPKIIGCQPPLVYDNFLAQTAAAAKMPVTGLETAEEQIAVVDSESLDEQLKSLKETTANPEKDISDFKTLYQTYLKQNSDELYDLVAIQFKVAGYSQPKMLDRRNENWIPVIEKNINAAPTFIAVGAGHLGGKKGVVNLLRAKGYKLTPIKL